MQWEYVALCWSDNQRAWVLVHGGEGDADRDNHVVAIMNRLGAQGWELAGVAPFATSPPDFYFKRPKDPAG
jgi:hypothetical protein